MRVIHPRDWPSSVSFNLTDDVVVRQVLLAFVLRPPATYSGTMVRSVGAVLWNPDRKLHDLIRASLDRFQRGEVPTLTALSKLPSEGMLLE